MTLPLFLILISQALGGGLTNLDFSFSPQAVRQSSKYTVYFSTTSAIPSNALVKITLPSECSISSSSSYSCSLSNPQGSTSTAYCVSDSSTLTVTVHNFFSSGSVSANYMFPFEISLNDVTNPKSNKATGSISISVTTSSGTVIDSDSDNSVTVITATAATISSAAITSSTQMVGSSAIFTFAITPTYSIPAGSVITIKFPYWNQNMNPTTFSHMITSSSPSCIGTVNIATSLSCSYTNSFQTLKVSNGFSSEVTGAIAFTVGSGLNPPNPDTLSGFIVYIRDSFDNDYESSNTFSIKVATPNSIIISDLGC